MTKVPMLHLIPPFLAGKVISDTVMVTAGRYAAGSLTDLLHGALGASSQFARLSTRVIAQASAVSGEAVLRYAMRPAAAPTILLVEDEVLISNNAIGAHGVIELVGHAGQLMSACCSPDGTKAASVDNFDVRVWTAPPKDEGGRAAEPGK